MFKSFFLILFLLSCNDTVNIKTIYINKTQKVQIQEEWKSEYNISYLWSISNGPENHNALWIVNQNIMLFTPYKTGNYVITVSIEDNMGNILGEEQFYYNAINKSTNMPSSNKKIHSQSIENNITNDSKKINGYTIQISSWNTLEDAKKAMSILKVTGYNAYIQKYSINEKIWHRVRIGKNISYNESTKLINDLNKSLINNCWIDEYK